MPFVTHVEIYPLRRATYADPRKLATDTYHRHLVMIKKNLILTYFTFLFIFLFLFIYFLSTILHWSLKSIYYFYTKRATLYILNFICDDYIHLLEIKFFNNFIAHNI